MEDAHTITLPIESAPEYSWFAVYDGHGGSLVSTESAKAVLGKITGSAEWRTDHRSLDSIRAAMKRGFLEMDEDLRKVRMSERASGWAGGGRASKLSKLRNVLLRSAVPPRPPPPPPCILFRLAQAIQHTPLLIAVAGYG